MITSRLHGACLITSQFGWKRLKICVYSFLSTILLFENLQFELFALIKKKLKKIENKSTYHASKLLVVVVVVWGMRARRGVLESALKKTCFYLFF